MSLAAACQEILHVRQLLKSLGIDFKGPFLMFEDNQGCISLATNAMTTTGNRDYGINGAKRTNRHMDLT